MTSNATTRKAGGSKDCIGIEKISFANIPGRSVADDHDRMDAVEKIIDFLMGRIFSSAIILGRKAA